MKYEDSLRLCKTLDVGPGLMVLPDSFSPYQIRLMERDYPNKQIAASFNAEAIMAAARLWRVGCQSKGGA